MQADRIRYHLDLLPGDGRNPVLLHHGNDTGNGFLLVGDDRALLAPCHERSVLFIGSVREDLPCIGKPRSFGALDQLRAGEPQQDQGRIHLPDSLTDGIRHGSILSRHVVHRTMGLYMLQRNSRCMAERLQRSHLVHDHCLELLIRNLQIPPAKADQIRKSRMRPHGNTRGLARGHRLLHYNRIRCMESAGDVGRGNLLHHLGIHSDLIVAEAFSHITVQINLHGLLSPAQLFSYRFFHTLQPVNTSDSRFSRR